MFLSTATIFVSLVMTVSSQASFSTLGTGILDSSYLARPGGLVFPNGDGRVEANSLAAAIYGVAIPSRFNDFVQSDNYFGQNNHNNQDNGGIFTPDFSVYSGLFGNGGGGHHFQGDDGGGNHQGGTGRELSSYVTDFSGFASGGGFLAPPVSNDLSSSASNNHPQGGLHQIDPVAARFGVVLPANENDPAAAALFHPSFTGPINGNTDDASRRSNNFYGDSPIKTTLEFQLPSQTTLPDLPLTAVSSPPLPNKEGDQVELSPPSTESYITSAFKLPDSDADNKPPNSDGEDYGVGEDYQQGSGKFSATISSGIQDNGIIDKEQPTFKTNIEETSKLSTTSPSPYVYRMRERLLAQQPSTTNFEKLPKPERLVAAGKELNPAAKTSGKRVAHRFMMAPGYRTRK